MLLHFIPKRTVSFLFIPTHSQKKALCFQPQQAKNLISVRSRWRTCLTFKQNPTHQKKSLLAEHESYYYTLEKDSVKGHPLTDPFAFWYEGKDVSVKAYNIDTSGNEVHVTDKKMNKTYKITLPSLP